MYYHTNENRLFSDTDLDSYLHDRREKLEANIQGLQLAVFSNPDDTALIKQLYNQYFLKTPVLKENQLTVKPVEADVDVRSNGLLYDEGESFTTKGLNITVEIPFEGEPELFLCRPSSWSSAPKPCASVQTAKLIMTYQTAEKESEKIKQLWLSSISEIKKYLSWIEGDLVKYNQSLETDIKMLVSKRKQESGSNQSLIEALRQD